MQKLDSIGYYKVIDSFQYDNQNRVTKYINIQRDTIFVYDTNGNITNMSPSEITNLATLNYVGNNSIPSTYIFNGQIVTLTANALGQIVKDSSSPTYVTHRFYNSGLVVVDFGHIDLNYSIDSISIDANSNVTSLLFGGNYFFDSLNNPRYGRVSLSKYTYGNIPNPVFANKSASVILFTFRNDFCSRYVKESAEYIYFDQNSAIVRDEVHNYQNVVDVNNVIQKSVSISNDEFIAWTYY